MERLKVVTIIFEYTDDKIYMCEWPENLDLPQEGSYIEFRGEMRQSIGGENNPVVEQTCKGIVQPLSYDIDKDAASILITVHSKFAFTERESLIEKVGEATAVRAMQE